MAENYLQKQSNIIFYKFLSLTLTFLGVILFSGFIILQKFPLAYKDILAKIKYNCSCVDHFVLWHHPWLLTFTILISAGLLFILTYLVVRALRVRKQTKNFIRINFKSKRKNNSAKLQNVTQSLDLSKQVVEVNNQNPVIFCYGYLRPKICISNALVRKLSKNELISVLSHEKSHIINRDPIKLFIVKILRKILFFVPAVKVLAQKYLIFSEIAADGLATENFKNKEPLVQALLKIINWRQQMFAKNNLAVSFLDTVLAERINVLSDINYLPKSNIFTLKLLLNSLALFFILTSFGIFVNFTTALAGQQNGAACSDTPSINGQCQMVGQNTCTMSQPQGEHYCQ